MRDALTALMALAWAGSASAMAQNPAPNWTALVPGDPDRPPVPLDGYAVDSAGDVNGDGFADVIVGNWTYSNNHFEEGGLWLYLGSAAGLSATPAWTAEGGSFQAGLGRRVCHGDFNGDGFSDIAACAFQYSHGQTGEGLIVVFHGGPDGLPSQSNGLAPSWSFETDMENAMGTGGLACAGNVNGDRDPTSGLPYEDLLVGAANHGGAARAWCFYGGAGGLSPRPSVTLIDPVAGGSGFGQSVAGAGDVDGDGCSDVVVSSTHEARVWLFYGSPLGLAPEPSWNIAGIASEPTDFGGALMSGADFDGDGCSDVVVGCRRSPGQPAGAVYIYAGRRDRSAFGAAFRMIAGPVGAIEDHFGASVAVGDYDADGHPDLLVGAPYVDSASPNGGATYLFRGGGTGLEPAPSWTAHGAFAYAHFGQVVAMAGDVDGNGSCDILARTIAGGGPVHGFYGPARQNPHPPLGLGQYRLDGTTTIPRQGLTRESGAIFTFRCDDEQGDMVTPVIEIREVGSPMTGTVLHRGVPVPSGQLASVRVDGLPPDRTYYWRARGDDESHQAPGRWTYFTSEASSGDFTVAANTPPTLVHTEIRDAATGEILPPGWRGALQEVILYAEAEDPEGEAIRVDFQAVPGGAPPSGIPAGSSRWIQGRGWVSLSLALPTGTDYRCFARVADEWGLDSGWRAFGGDPDFKLDHVGSMGGGLGCGSVGATIPGREGVAMLAALVWALLGASGHGRVHRP